MRLRAAALSIVGAAGIDALSDEQLVRQAGLDPADLREHYETASACLYATYEDVAAAIYEDFAAALASERGWYDGLRAGAVALLRRLTAHPAQARLCFAEILHGDYELLHRREASRRRLVALFVSELGRRREQPELFSMQLELLIGACFQTIAAAVTDHGEQPLESLVPELESRAQVFELTAA